MANCILPRVDDDSFLAAWNDEQVQNMLAFACKSYRHMDRDEYDQMQRRAVWMAVRDHDVARGRKLVNLLCNRVRWLMSTEERTESRKRKLRRKILDNARIEDACRMGGQIDVDSADTVARLMAELTDLEQEVVHRKVVEGEDLKAIGASMKMSVDRTSDVFHGGMAKLKRYADRNLNEHRVGVFPTEDRSFS